MSFENFTKNYYFELILEVIITEVAKKFRKGLLFAIT